MKVRITYQEHTTRVVDVEVASLEAAQAEWALRYDSAVVDGWLNESVETDGGELWDSASFEVLS